MPQADGYGLFARIPVKQLGEGDITVSVGDEGDAVTTTIVTVKESEPFDRLQDLDNACLSENEQGIIFKARSEAPRDSGQSQTPLRG